MTSDSELAVVVAPQTFPTPILIERAGYQDLEDIEPVTVAAYIETLQRQAAPPTVKQHMAAIRMLFSWLTEKGVLAGSGI